MEFTWNEKTINWFENASTYTGFHKKLAEAVCPMLRGYNRLCDLGCGLGKLDLELSKDIEHITCLDINPLVTNNLQKHIEKNSLSNITVKTQSSEEFIGQWDVLLLSYFGSCRLPEYLEHARKLIVILDHKKTSLYPQKYKPRNVADTMLMLEQQGIPYQCTTFEFEFGQPFHSFAEAQDFVYVYTGYNDDSLSSFLKEHLIPIQQDSYTWYLPHRKSIAVLEIKGKEEKLENKNFRRVYDEQVL